MPYDAELERDTRLRRAADPVIDRLAAQLADAPVTILLADRNARIVDRRAGDDSLLRRLDAAQVAPGFGYAEEYSGTNGIGTALEERRLFEVRGGEHFRESLQNLACVGTPIVHPIARSIEGIIDITCQVADVSDLMAPLVSAAVRDIEDRLYDYASYSEQALLREFLRSSRRHRTAVLAMSQDMVLTNTAASRLLDPTDHAVIWTWASEHLDTAEEQSGELHLGSNLMVHACAHRVADVRGMLGIIVEIREAEKPPTPASAKRPRIDSSPAIGGRSLPTRRLQEQLDLLATSPGPVLIAGESGVGKAHVATYLARRWNPDVELRSWDAAGDEVKESRWLDDAQSHLEVGGAVLVCGIDELPEQHIARFEGFVEWCERRSYPLEATARGAECSEVNALHAYFNRRIWVVPLRQRTDEIEDLARSLLARHVAGRTPPRLQPAALQCLMSYEWPGNVRELESVLSSAGISSLHGDITVQHLPPQYRSASPTKHLRSLERAEREAIIQALDETAGNKAAAAERLGIARSTLYRKMRWLGLEPDRFS